ncbi:AIR synthase-related protein [Clostridium sp. C105KSO13]|uniref:AIR synthase-related protein n=1 Tax=Clostridium sp. C105KSO13 TaxID=1776045 RepID=UPI00074070D5|nr:AIR synthase-related protein [Clostridium sp. C105KSO13]CUX32098.1 Hydrogenase expression/formation protein HypE [Clostridium sp. C105KSO13]
MKVGNISQTVWNRSVYRQLYIEGNEILLPPSLEEPCSAFCLPAEQEEEKDCKGVWVYTNTEVFGDAANVGNFAVYRVLNDLAVRGACPVSVSLRILLTSSVTEARLKEMISCTEAVCKTVGVPITGIKAEVSPAVIHPVLFAAGVGYIQAESMTRASDALPGQDLILCGYAGLEGTLRILSEREDELAERFVPAFIRRTMELENQLPAMDAITAARCAGVSAMHQVGQGGIFAALWELGEASGVGMEVDMHEMSMRQETIEICEYYGLNPYQLTSAGCILMTADDGGSLVRILEGVGARATRLGVIRQETARVITSKTEQRFLERPAPDELMLWWERE